MKNLSEHVYIEGHESCPDTDTVKDILWAHTASIDLLHAFFWVLIMDYCWWSITDQKIEKHRVEDLTATEA